MDGPQSHGTPKPVIKPELTFRDMVVLKQSVEKGLRENFYSNQERSEMMIICQKIGAIIIEYEQSQDLKN